MEYKTYLSNCPKCREETKHGIYLISRKRGIKLQCLKCGKIKGRYYNHKALEEYKPEVKE